MLKRKTRFGACLVEYHVVVASHIIRYQIMTPELKGVKQIKARIAIGAGVQPYRETKLIATVVKDWYTNPNTSVNDDAANDIIAVAKRIFKI